MSRRPSGRDLLVRNASALMLSSVGTGALGLVYWIIAEHHFPTSEVGRASAIISSATVLSSLACLSLGGAYQRFLPVSGDRTVRLLLGGHLLITATATLLGTGFVLLGFGDRLLFSTGERWGFVAMVIVFAQYAICDPILTGLRQAPAVAAKNIGLSAIKIVPLVVITATPTAFVITGSWAVAAAVITAIAIFHGFRVALRRRDESHALLPGGRELLSFQSAFFAMMLVSSVTPLVLPLLVVHQAGTTQNAYFNLAWTMCSAVGLLRAAVGSAFVVEAALPDADRPALLRRFGRMLAAVTALGAGGLAIGGPLVLWFTGPDYLHAAAPLMMVMAVDSIVQTCVTTYYLVAQLQRRLRLMVAAQIVVMVLTVGGSAVLLAPLGLVGVAVGSLSASVVALLIVARPLVRGIREMATVERPVEPVG
ncbi:polysaccharide biosynthesis protein [Gordonia desulfuricans]|uniref:Polysaccharide biosynthesis protein n=1 Tax=Gordonia desulfuricans TaxID=89051 RepID=A0A7K3LXN5_9ACTN|nr:polysaccharide biosynthesis protein [Gordonia desulfuricans]NDK92297.1 polysaccharide biosynthesis protein [Gordonia desulfuricans]